MGKIGDLWVRLGLKNEEFKSKIDESSRDVEDFGKKSSVMSTVAKTAWAAVAAAVVKFCSDAINLTQKWGDQWAQTMAGVKTAYQQFVRQLASGDGWNNLFQNMAEAYNKGKEIAAALDEVFERKMSLSYEEAYTEKLKSELDLIYRDQSKSNEEREAAARRILQIEDELGKKQKYVAEQEANAKRSQFQLATGLTDIQTRFMVGEYLENEEIIKQARDFDAERIEIEQKIARLRAESKEEDFGTLSNTDLAKTLKDYDEFMSKTPQHIKNVAEWTRGYDRANDALVEGLAAAEIALIKVQTNINRQKMRANTYVGSLYNSGASTDSSTPEAAAPVARTIGDTDLNLSQPAIEAAAAYSELESGLAGADSRMLAITEHAEGMKNMLDDAIDRVYAFAEAVSTGASGAMEEFMSQLMGVKDFNVGSILQALLTPLADMAIKEGEIAVASGIAIDAIKKGLAAFTGTAPIAAGLALIGVGAAAKAGLAALASKGSGGSAATSMAASSSGSMNGAATGSETMEITVNVAGTIKGRDIVLAGSKTQSAWGR